MKKVLSMFLMFLVPLSGCSNDNGDYDYNRISYPIELSKTINSVLEKDDNWECEDRYCVYEFKDGSTALLDIEFDDDFSIFMIESDGFDENVITLNYNVINNKIIIHGAYGLDPDWCELTDEAKCKVDFLVFPEEGMNIVREFRDYILELLYDYITNLN